MNFLATIEKPWKQPIEYITLAFWLAVFVVVFLAITDMLRSLPSFIGDVVE